MVIPPQSPSPSVGPICFHPPSGLHILLNKGARDSNICGANFPLCNELASVPTAYCCCPYPKQASWTYVFQTLAQCRRWISQKTNFFRTKNLVSGSLHILPIPSSHRRAFCRRNFQRALEVFLQWSALRINAIRSACGVANAPLRINMFYTRKLVWRRSLRKPKLCHYLLKIIFGLK